MWKPEIPSCRNYRNKEKLIYKYFTSIIHADNKNKVDVFAETLTFTISSNK